jgi:hypothetical protein
LDPVLAADDQLFVPVVVYVHAANTGSKPGSGSRSVPLKAPPAVIVPVSSIAVPPDPLRLRVGRPVGRSTKPLTAPVTNGEATCQTLVLLFTVPSVSTTKVAVNIWPSASDPLEQARALVGWTTNDQLPDAWAEVIEPPPPIPMKGSVLVSQPAAVTSRVKQRMIGRT